ncbi:MAG: 1-deoxy-D-xylulose-5-phosphate synthase [Thermoanaerobacterales bacterium 50_218]|nr:MAG: 1-deoxy-D-xylulose-5-phosphate synthase [Thermoanaerobacterales bacterium 50_218]HAA90458.1 1-deoxy-D-xylulose-5-phosphate synthase [Peptococcaceae bacterium]
MILEKIEGPSDLRKLSWRELDKLAQEIREFLLETVSRTGGHLAPNLGVVELTIALHLVFDSPKDKIIWDVGHQCYVHKILTGRRKQFPTLRQYGGLSGFPKYRESPHDCFQTGHSSTSISAALGFALARDLNGENYSVVAVIGDGALTAGMAFEGLNHAGHLGAKIIVVLNDNEMSIANNVGALSNYLSRLRTEPLYHRSKEELEDLLRKIPNIGPRMIKAVERLKDGVKYLLVPGMFFEELGFTYLGPIDGHNVRILWEVFERAKTMTGPVLVHVYTKKGKGYYFAEKKPEKFHGIGPFNIKTGEPIAKSDLPTYTQVFGEYLTELATENPKIVAITAAMPDGTGLSVFAKRFPERFFDVGIAEQHAVTFAAGLARAGYFPVVAIYSTFLQRSFDQIIHDVALQDLPVVFALDRAGLVGEDGETHHGIFDLSYLRCIPGIIVMAPKDENELRRMLKSAFHYKAPVAIRYPRGAGQGVPLDPSPEFLPPGRGELLREGKDLVILAVGPLVYTALDVAEKLSEKGQEAAVVNCRFIKPLDEELILELAQQTGRVLTIEENVLAGGFGSAVLEFLGDRGYRGEVARVGIPNCFVEHGSPQLLRQQCGLDVQGILNFLQKKGWFNG